MGGASEVSWAGGARGQSCRTELITPSSMSASAAWQIRISGTDGGSWLYDSLEPSIRDACSPAARATATGAAESHSYCPPLCTYASASPPITPAALAPAEPSGSSRAPVLSPRPPAHSGGLVRLTASRSVMDVDVGR